MEILHVAKDSPITPKLTNDTCTWLRHVYSRFRKMLTQCRLGSRAGFELKCEETLSIDRAHAGT